MNLRMQIAFSHHVVPLNNNNGYLNIIIVSGYYNKKIWTDIEQTLMSKNILAVKLQMDILLIRELTFRGKCECKGNN